MKMVTAIVRTASLERIVNHLDRIGIRSMTISEIKGIGEQVNVNTPYTIHDKIELIVPDEKADVVARVIFEQARTGLAGDGLIAVFPMDSMTKIRTGEIIHDGNFHKM